MSSASVIARPKVARAAKVTVTVGEGETIVCSPDPIDVKRGQTAVEFRIGTPGYLFRQKNAIVVSDPGRDFPLPSTTSPDGTVATLRDRRLDRREYKYSVYLVELASGKVICVDPTIRNEPD